MEIVQVGQEPRTLNMLPLRGPLGLPSHHPMPWCEGQRTRAMVLKEVACKMKARPVGARKSDMQGTVLCRMRNEGTKATALIRYQTAESMHAVLLPTQGADHQIPEVDTVH